MPEPPRRRRRQMRYSTDDVADALGVPRSTLNGRLKRAGVRASDFVGVVDYIVRDRVRTAEARMLALLMEVDHEVMRADRLVVRVRDVIRRLVARGELQLTREEQQLMRVPGVAYWRHDEDVVRERIEPQNRLWWRRAEGWVGPYLVIGPGRTGRTVLERPDGVRFRIRTRRLGPESGWHTYSERIARDWIDVYGSRVHAELARLEGQDPVSFQQLVEDILPDAVVDPTQPVKRFPHGRASRDEGRDGLRAPDRSTHPDAGPGA